MFQPHTFNVLFKSLLQVHIFTKCRIHGTQASTPTELRADSVKFVQVVFCKAGRRVVGVTWIRHLQHPTSALAPIDRSLGNPLLPLNSHHLRLLHDANSLSASEMHKNMNATGKPGSWIRYAGRVIGDEAAEAKLGIVVEYVEVLEAETRGVAIR